MNRTMEIVNRIGKINFEGNIIPHNWFAHLRFENGKPHTNAIILLSEIVYWYRPTILKDEATGRVIEVRKKFKADKLQRSYDSFAKQFGFTKRQAKEAIKFLEGKGLISLEFRHITIDSGSRLANVLFVEPDPGKLEFITHVTLERKTLDGVTVDVYASNGRRDTLKCKTNTDTTTEITTEITTEGPAQKPPPIPADFLPDTETQMGILFSQNGRGIEGQLQAISRAGWNIRGEDIRNATAHFLKASGLPIPNDVSTRKDWIKSISQQVNNFGVVVLEKAYPLAMRQCEGLTIGRPGALDKTLPAVIRDMKNGGKPHDRTKSQRVPGRIPAYSVADPAAFHDQRPDDEGA